VRLGMRERPSSPLGGAVYGESVNNCRPSIGGRGVKGDGRKYFGDSICESVLGDIDDWHMGLLTAVIGCSGRTEAGEVV
jgi:hypothetical protein